MGDKKTEILAWGQTVLAKEATALGRSREALGSDFVQAVNLACACQGRIALSGLGKSGHVAAKVAATLASTGTPAYFLHPSEALHGDFGQVQAEDLLIAIAYSGETREVLAVVKFFLAAQQKVVAITGNSRSPLARLSHAVLDGEVSEEADSLGLAPTCSSTVAMALGDALAVALMRSRDFSEASFARLHPGGRLGMRFRQVSELMRKREELVPVRLSSSFHEVLSATAQPNFGLLPVLDDAGDLQGAISDGDFRRVLASHGPDAFKLKAADFMNTNPKWVEPTTSLNHAITMMDELAITGLFVLERGGRHPRRLVGLLRLHDLLGEKVV